MNPHSQKWTRERKLTLDAINRKATAQVRPTAAQQRIERWYINQLKKVAGRVDELLNGLGPLELVMFPTIERILTQYAEILTPWATKTADYMIRELDKADREIWRQQSHRLSEGVRNEIFNTPVGNTYRELMARNVMFIKKIPLEAAVRMNELAFKNLIGGFRGEELLEAVREGGDVARSYAVLVARTESNRAASVFHQARAMHAGSRVFLWRTVHDASVRPTHAKLDGHQYEWGNPPECDPGIHALPGQVFNCRCHAQAVFDD